MAASACPLRFRPVSLAGGRLRAAHRCAAVVARQPPSRSIAGLLFLRGVGSLRAFVLSSSNVPGWVVSQPWWLVSVVVAFRRRFESPRAYRPAPRKRGACAADETAALPRGQRWTLDTPHRRAHVASLSRPLVLALLPIFRSAPHRGGHTPKNLTLFARLATHLAAGGPEATPRARRTPLPQSPRPFPVGKGGRGVTDPLRRGRGLLSSHCPPVAPFVAHHDIRVSLPRQGPQKFSLGNFLLSPLTRQRPADVPATPNGKTKTERKDPSMKNFDEIIKESVLNIITSMTDAEIRNLVETWMLEYGDGVACMIADRVRKIAESVLFDLPF